MLVIHEGRRLVDRVDRARAHALLRVRLDIPRRRLHAGWTQISISFWRATRQELLPVVEQDYLKRFFEIVPVHGIGDKSHSDLAM